MKQRADKTLVEDGLADNLHKAHALILAGLAYTEKEKIQKPGQLIPKKEKIYLKEKKPFVSRGGIKLNEAILKFGIHVKDKIAADLGSSTGGFTDCLLQHGAKHVFAVDVDPRQLDWNLSRDPRVSKIKKNVRYLKISDFPKLPEIIVMDVSFISILTILPCLVPILGQGDLLALIKPQFEVEKHQVGKKGIVKNTDLHKDILEKILVEANSLGLRALNLIKTSIRGQKGNQEFFVHWKINKKTLSKKKIYSMVLKAVGNEKNK